MDGVDESGQSCVFTDRHHLAYHRSLSQNEPCFDDIADLDINRYGFAGQRRFVEGSRTFEDTGIGRNQFTAAYFDVVPGMNEVDGDDVRGWPLMRRCNGASCSHERRGQTNRSEGDGGHRVQRDWSVMVHLPGGSREAVQATLHGFPRFDERIAFQMDGEGYQNGDNKRLFPHAEDACTDDGEAG